LDALTKEESEPTKVYALYGYRIALSDYHVMKWKQRTANHYSHIHIPEHYGHDIPECWLCKFEAAHTTQQQ